MNELLHFFLIFCTYILKSILFIGVCSLLIILAVILIILFVPISYNIKVRVEEDFTNPHIKTRVSWLLHFIYAKGEYVDGEFIPRIRVFGFCLYPKKVRLTFKEKIRANKVTQKVFQFIHLFNENVENKCKTQDTKDVKITKNPHIDEMKNIYQHSKVLLDDSDDIISMKISKNPFKRWKKQSQSIKNKCGGTKDKIFKQFKKIKWHFNKFYAMIKRGIKGKDTIIEFFGHKTHKESLNHLKKELLFLWRHSKPRTINVKAKFGFEDPALTGQIIGLIGLSLPIIGEYNLDLEPRFEEEILDLDLEIKGKIYMIHILLSSVKVIRVKRNRYTFKRIQKLEF